MSAYEAAESVLKDRFSQVEKVLDEGPHFGGEAFTLVDAAFAPVFRYFDVFDPVSGVDVFAQVPKTHAWRTALAQRRSVKEAVVEDYPALLHDFVIRQGGILGRRLG